MKAKEWVKSALVAAGGGACGAIAAAVMDPHKFNLADGIKDELFIALQGAMVGLGALFIRSPLGSGLLRTIEQTQQKLAEDQAAIEKVKEELKKNG